MLPKKEDAVHEQHTLESTSFSLIKGPVMRQSDTNDDH